MTPRKTVLWVFQDNAVIWNGIIWDWNHQTVLDGTLPISATSVDSLLAHRVIAQTFKFTNMDVFDMFRALVQYAVGLKPNGQVAGLTYTTGESGIRDTVTFDGTQYQDVGSAVSQLVTDYEIEYSFRPYQDASGNLHTSVDLAYPYLGQGFPQSGLVYNMPGNVNDYGFQASGSSGANYIIASATPSSSASSTVYTSSTVYVGTYQDTADLNLGYPLLELSLSPQGTLWNTSAQLANYAKGYLPQVRDTVLTPVLTIAGGQSPTIGQTVLGSFAQVALTSSLHPAKASGAPGYTGLGRVTGWTVTPPTAQSPESAQVQMGDMAMTV